MSDSQESGEKTVFAQIMDTLHDAEVAARHFDGEGLRGAAGRLSTLAATYPPPDEDDDELPWELDTRRRSFPS